MKTNFLIRALILPVIFIGLMGCEKESAQTQEEAALDADLLDAIGEYMAMHGDWAYGFIEDGTDIYPFAAGFSAITVAFLYY